MKKGLLIYNAKSGNKLIASKLDVIFEKFQEKDITIQPYRLQHTPKKLKYILQKKEFDFIILAGGDGTVNFGANMIMKCCPGMPVGIIPAGTCNDFARCINLPNTVEECVDLILDNNIAKVDIGLVNKDQYFLSTYAGGLFAGISFDTNAELKKRLGPFAYYLNAMNEVMNINPFKLEIKTDNSMIEEEAVLYIIVNGKHAAGFKDLVKTAELTDGLMDIIIIKNCQHIDLTNLFFKVLSNEFLNDENVRMFRTKCCEIKKVDKDISVTIDGEKSINQNCKIEFLNKKFSVFVKSE